MDKAEWFNAAMTGDIKTLRKCIQNQQRDINIQDVDGWTLLIFAAAHGHDQCVRQLLRLNASIDKQNQNGETALMIAAYNGHYPCVKLLLQSGADPSKLTEIRCSPKIQHVVKDFESQLINQVSQVFIPDLAKVIVQFIIPKFQ